jgi:glycine/D-amino acid oxidase-like deaminating enzyme
MRAVPYFLDGLVQARRPDYPRHRGDQRVQVAIVGGGLTGAACAAAFAGAGVQVVLLEADRIGAGGTAGSPGLLRQDLDGSFQAAARDHGLRTARHLWQGFRRSALDFSAAMRRLEVRAGLEPRDVVVFARQDADAARSLQRECTARRDAGIECSWVSARVLSNDARIEAAGGIRTKGAALDPYRAAVGLARAAARRGAVIHERTAARRIRGGRKAVEITTDGGLITADAVVIATGGLPDDLHQLRRHFKETQSYGVVTDSLPAAVRREVGSRAMAMRDSASPPHVLRWLDDRVLFAGADQPPVSARLRDKTLIQRSHQLMYELTTLYPAISGVQPAYGWDLPHYGSPDGFPVVGPHRNFPRHLFALGHGRHGAAVAWLAARLLLREFLGEPAREDQAFGFGRIL